MRRQFLEPNLIIVQQAFLSIIDEHGGGNMHGVHQTKSFLDGAFADQLRYAIGDVHEAASIRYFKPEMFGKAFHPAVYRRFCVNRLLRRYTWWLKAVAGMGR